MPVALVTGASRGLGEALAQALAARGWHLIVDGRDEHALRQAIDQLGTATEVTAIAGDVTDMWHRDELRRAVAAHGRLDLLVNNASTLGPSPLPDAADLDLNAYRRVLEVNTVAPLALTQLVLDDLRSSNGTVLSITSDAAVEPYPAWSGYGSAKAALERWTVGLGAEEPAIRAYAVDPGDLRTEMHQRAFPGEDISDRPEPATAVPALLRLVDERPPSGRYRATELRIAEEVAS